MHRNLSKESSRSCTLLMLPRADSKACRVLSCRVLLLLQGWRHKHALTVSTYSIPVYELVCELRGSTQQNRTQNFVFLKHNSAEHNVTQRNTLQQAPLPYSSFSSFLQFSPIQLLCNTCSQNDSCPFIFLWL